MSDASINQFNSHAPAFSVILTTFNRSHLVGRAIQSVLQQSFPAFELIIVDDCSTDATPEVVSAFTDARLCYLRLPENHGVGHARNLGIQKAAGEYIAFVDDDDTIVPTFLEEVYAAFCKSPATVGFLWSWKEVVRQTEGGLERLEQRTYGSTSDAPRSGKQLLRKVVGASSGLVVRAEAFGIVGGFNPELRAVGDTELLIRLATAFDYIILPRPLYRVFAGHGAQLTAPSLLRAQAYARIIELHYDLLRKYPGTLRVQYLGCARMYYQLGDRRQARQYMKRLLEHEPLNWKNWMLFLLLENLKFLPSKLSRRVTRRSFA